MRYREISYQEKESKMNKEALHQKRRNEIARQEGRPPKKKKVLIYFTPLLNQKDAF